jgi:hypothetical protein
MRQMSIRQTGELLERKMTSERSKEQKRSEGKQGRNDEKQRKG